MALVIKNPPANAGDVGDGFHPWGGKIPWRRKWQPTPVFLPGASHGQGSLVAYRPWSHKEPDTSEETYRAHSVEKGAIGKIGLKEQEGLGGKKEGDNGDSYFTK